MSFDLGVWHSERPITVEEAGDLYLKLCKQEWVPIEESPAVEAFYRESCGKYPEIDMLPEDQVDESPFSCAHDRSGLHVLVAISYGQRTTPVAQYVVELAEKHGLICYDPQGPDVYLPPHLKPKASRFRFW
jgi:hypothetical protein